MNKVMFSSESVMWSTPQNLFDALNKVFWFDVDVCATAEDAKCADFYSPEQDGLKQEWRGTCWMNPPYGREIGKWIKKAHESAQQNMATVVCLVPARTDTRWWQQYCNRAEHYFIAGRLKFGDGKSPAPFPSAIVVFRPSVLQAIESIRKT